MEHTGLRSVKQSIEINLEDKYNANGDEEKRSYY